MLKRRQFDPSQASNVTLWMDASDPTTFSTQAYPTSTSSVILSDFIGTPPKTPYTYGAIGLVQGNDQNFYVAHADDGAIYKITLAGVITTFVTGLNGPVGITKDSSGNFYVSCVNAVIKVTPGGTVSTFASSTTYFAGTGGGITIDLSGNLYVTNPNTPSIMKVTSGGTVSQILSAGSSSPISIAYASDGFLYVACGYGSPITRLFTDGSQYSTFGAPGAGIVSRGIVQGADKSLYITSGAGYSTGWISQYSITQFTDINPYWGRITTPNTDCGGIIQASDFNFYTIAGGKLLQIYGPFNSPLMQWNDKSASKHTFQTTTLSNLPVQFGASLWLDATDPSTIITTPIVLSVGGGGGRGGDGTSLPGSSGGGGGSGYLTSFIMNSYSPGTVLTITVGAGGTATLVADGGASAVFVGSTPIAIASGGKAGNGARGGIGYVNGQNSTITTVPGLGGVGGGGSGGNGGRNRAPLIGSPGGNGFVTLTINGIVVQSYTTPGTYTFATPLTWKDKSGFGNNAIATGSPSLSPSINGRNAIYFNGSSWFKGALANTGTQLTAFCVARTPASQTTNTRILSLGVTTDVDYNSTNYTIAIYQPALNVGTYRTPNQVFGQLTADIPYVTSTLYDGTNGSTYLNGNLTGSFASTGAFGFTAYGLGNYVGAPVYGNEPFIGYIGEMIVFNSALNSSQRQQMEGYLAWKWGTQTSLAVNHQYLSIPAIVPSQTSTPDGVPSAIPGCVLWLDGKDQNGTGTVQTTGSLATWLDKSGQQNNAISQSGTVPVSSSGGATFDGSTQYFKIPGLAGALVSTPFIVFAVETFTGNFVAKAWYFGDDANTAVTDSTLTLGYRQSGSPLGSGAYTMSFWSDDLNDTNYNTSSPTGVVRLWTNYLPAASNRTIRVNGKVDATHTNYTQLNAFAIPTLGRANGGFYYKGTISELIVFNRDIGLQYIQQIETYLAAKWNIALPYTAPPLPSPKAAVYIPPQVQMTSTQKAGYGTPLYIPGCVLWVDASDPTTIFSSGTTATAWADKSGSGSAASASSGTVTTGSTSINGLNALSFSAGAGMTLPIYYTQTSRTVIVVGSVGAASGVFGNTYTFLNSVYSGTSPVQFGSYYGGTQQLSIAYNGTSSIYTNNPPNFFSSTFVLSCTQNANDLTSSGIFINGVSLSLSSTSAQTQATFPTGLGYQVVGSSTGNPVTIGELLVFDGGLSTLQRQQVEGYLAKKWNTSYTVPNQAVNYGYFSVLPTSQQPTTIPNCQLWLDAADSTAFSFTTTGTVSSWNDKSGAGNHLNTAYNGNPIRTVDNGQPVVSIASGNILQSTSTVTIGTTSTLFIVARLTAAQPGSGSSGYIISFPGINSGDFSVRSGLTNIVNGDTNDFGLQNYFVNGTSFVGVTGSIQCVNNSSYIIITGTAAVSRTGTSQIAISTSFFSRYFIGNIAEVLLFSKITPFQSRQVEGYLGKKWNIPVSQQSSAAFSCGSAVTPVYATPSVQSPFSGLPGLYLWLDGSDPTTYSYTGTGGSLASWSDKSGSGLVGTPQNDNGPITQKGEILNGQPTVYLGSSRLKFPSFTWNSSFTQILVLKTPGGTFFNTLGLADSGGGYLSYLTDFNCSQIYIPQGNYGGSDVLNPFCGGTISPANQWHIFTIGYNQGTSATNYSVNGVYHKTGTFNTPQSTVASTTSEFRINGWTGPADSIQYAEVLHFNQCLTLAQNNQILQYLSTKWGIPLATPVPQPDSSSMTMFTVVQTPQASSIVNFSFGNGNSPGTPNSGVGLRVVGSTNLMKIPYLGPLTIGNRFNILAPSSTTLLVASYGAVSNAATGSYTFNSNLDMQASEFGNSFVNTPYSLGSSNAAFYTSELIVVNGALSTTDREQIEGYLSAKWGLGSQELPSYPYKTLPPVPTQWVDLSIPSKLPYLVSWLDASDPTTCTYSGTTLTGIVDKAGGVFTLSGTAGNITQSTIGNLGGLLFPGSQSFGSTAFPYLIKNWIAPYTGSAMMVVNPLTTTGIVQFTNIVGWGGTNNGSTPYGPVLAVSSNSLLVGRGGVGNPQQPVIVTLGAGTPILIYVAWYGSNIYLSVNGSNVGISPGSTYGYTASNFYIGNDAGQGANMVVGEIITFNTTLQTSTRQLLEGYLGWKWNMQTNLPTTHPYRSSAPTTDTTAELLAMNVPATIPTLSMWLDAGDSGTVIPSSPAIVPVRNTTLLSNIIMNTGNYTLVVDITFLTGVQPITSYTNILRVSTSNASTDGGGPVRYPSVWVTPTGQGYDNQNCIHVSLGGGVYWMLPSIQTGTPVRLSIQQSNGVFNLKAYGGGLSCNVTNYSYTNSSPGVYSLYCSDNVVLAANTVTCKFVSYIADGVVYYGGVQDKSAVSNSLGYSILTTNDLSSNVMPILQSTTPLLPGLYFNGSNNSMTSCLSSGLTSNITAFLVSTLCGNMHIVTGAETNGGTTSPGGQSFGFAASNLTSNYSPWIDGAGSTCNIKTTYANGLQEFFGSVYCNTITGATNFGSSSTTTLTAVMPSNYAWVFGYNTFTGTTSVYNSGFYVHEFLTFRGVLSDYDQQRIEGYLAWKWNLTAKLPSTHPYFTSRPYNVAFTPTSLPGLQLWLDSADKSSISLNGSTALQWNDKSGQGNNASATTPAVYSSASGGLVFTGTQTYFTPLTSQMPNQTVFSVVAYSGTTFMDIVSVNALTGVGGLQQTINNGVLALHSYGGSLILNGGTATQNLRFLYDYTFSASGPSYGYSNGLQVSSTLSAYPLSGTGTVNIGGYNGGGAGNEPYVGVISEILIYNTILSTLQRQQVETYLAQKWGFVPSLIPGLKVWFDGADQSTITGTTTVTQWRDKSGLGNNAAGNGGLSLVSGTGIAFNGTSGYFTIPGIANSVVGTSFCVFIVETVAGLPTTYQAGLFGDDAIVTLDSLSKTSLHIYYYPSGVMRFGMTSGTNDPQTPSGPFSVGVKRIWTFYYNGSQRSLRLNGSQVVSQPWTTNIDVGTFSSPVMGRINGTKDYNYNGTIHELALYTGSTALAIPQIQLVEQSLINKWKVGL